MRRGFDSVKDALEVEVGHVGTSTLCGQETGSASASARVWQDGRTARGEDKEKAKAAPSLKPYSSATLLQKASASRYCTSRQQTIQ